MRIPVSCTANHQLDAIVESVVLMDERPVLGATRVTSGEA